MKVVVLQLMIHFSQIFSGSSLKLKCEVNSSAIMSCQFGLPSVISDDARSFLKNISKESLIPNDTMLTCYHGSPNILARKAVGVFLREYRTEPEVEYFRHPSWAEIEFLDIHSCADDFHLFLSDQFSSLKKLKYLGIHYPGNGLEMAKTAFKGLDSLKILDLSDCEHFFLNDPVKYPFMVNALSGKDILPKIDMLNLEKAGIFNGRPMKMDSSLFRMVLHSNIKAIKLRGQTLIVSFKFHDIWTTKSYIPFPVVSIQAAMIVLVIADYVKAENKWRNIPIWTVLQNFQYLNLSDIDISRLATHSYNPYRLYSLCKEDSTGDTFTMTFVVFLVEINIRNFKGGIDKIENLNVDASACTIMRLKTIRMNQIGIRKLNVTWRIPDKKCLSEIDVSDNNISYFFIKGNLQTKKLVLRNNSLQEMNDHPEFSQALVSFTLLEHLDVSWNGLRSLPRNIFRTNINLKVILMNNNKLTSIPFLMNNLKSLQALQLRNNWIKYLDQYNMAAVEEAIKGFHTFVDLTQNPFECSCRTARFIRWLPSTLKQSQEYTCSMEESKVTITRSTFKSCQYLCYRDIVHICAIIGCCSLVILMTVVCLRKYKALREKQFERNKQTFIANFANGNLYVCSAETQENKRIEYIVMPAYHEDDYEICKTYIYEPLSAGLAALIGTDEKLVLFGLDKETPGVPKSAEMERCTEICCVYLCVVTRAFCGDYWCQIQLENADREGKPIVFLFVEDLGDNIPPFMKVLLSRVFVMRIDCSEDILTPTWETSCLKILNLAVRAHVNVQPQAPLPALFQLGIDLVYSCILSLCRKQNQYELIELRS